MNFLKAGRPTGFLARITVAVLILLTVAVSCVLYKTTSHFQSGTQLSSYTLKLETRNHRFPEDIYSFDYSCLYSDRGASCRQQSQQVTIYPGLFSILKFSSEVAPGDYHGIRVRINGSSGKAFEIKSAELQGKVVFDGQDYSVFKNLL